MKSFKVKLKTASDARMDEAIRQILLTRDAFHLKKKFWCKNFLKFQGTNGTEFSRMENDESVPLFAFFFPKLKMADSPTVLFACNYSRFKSQI